MYWMDAVRYADTGGDNGDSPVPEARLYHDYIIDSFNPDKPYDRFVTEQLAGAQRARIQLCGERRGDCKTFASQCLVARRFLARGVRMVEVIHRRSDAGHNWDSHGNMVYHRERATNAAAWNRLV